MAAEAKFEVGDVIRMKKPHPCGSSEWEILSRGGFSPEMSGMRTPGNGTAQTG